MKKVKVAICASLFLLAVGCSNQDLAEDTEPLVDTIEQQKGTTSNGRGGGYQRHVCYESNNGGNNPPPCNNNGTGSGSNN